MRTYTEIYPANKLEYFDNHPTHEVLMPWHANRFCESSAARLCVVENGSLFAWGRGIYIYDSRGELLPDVSLGVDEPMEKVPDIYDELDIEADLICAPSRQPDGYYHWVTETLPLFGLLARSNFRVHENSYLYLHRLKKRFQRRFLEIEGITIDRVLGFERESASGRTIARPIKINASRIVIAQWRLVNGAGWINRSVCSVLREEYSGPKALHPMWKDSESPRFLYLKRGENAVRHVLNEDELLLELETRGFAIATMEGRELSEQAQIFRDADYVLAAHGAGLANIVFSKSGTRVMEYCGGYVSNGYRSLSLLCGLHYHVVGAGLRDDGTPIPVSNARECGKAGFRIDVRKILDELHRVWNIGDSVVRIGGAAHSAPHDQRAGPPLHAESLV